MQATLSANASPSFRWIHRFKLPSDNFPSGASGILSITSYTRRGKVTANYMVDAIFDGERIVGWEMTNLTNNQTYDIDMEWGWSQAQCDCGSCVFGRRACKHVLALRSSLQQIGLLP